MLYSIESWTTEDRDYFRNQHEIFLEVTRHELTWQLFTLEKYHNYCEMLRLIFKHADCGNERFRKLAFSIAWGPYHNALASQAPNRWMLSTITTPLYSAVVPPLPHVIEGINREAQEGSTLHQLAVITIARKKLS